MSREYVEKRLREIARERDKNQRADKSHSLSNETKICQPEDKKPGLVRPFVPSSGRAIGTTPNLDSSLPRMYVQGSFIYDFHSFDHRSDLTLENRCGSFLDQVLGILATKPPYVHASDLARHLALTREFRQLQVPNWSNGRSMDVPMNDLPLQRMGRALEQWISSAVREDPFSLMPTFRLDTARFLESHAWGDTFYSSEDRERWELRPLLKGMGGRQPYGLDQDKKLKGDITSGMRGMIVRFRLPLGARLLDTQQQVFAVGPVDAYLAIERCHLSHGPESHPWMRHLQILEDSPMRHDIADEFRLLGCLWSSEAVEQLIAGTSDGSTHPGRSYKLEVPGRWITATLRPSDDDTCPSWHEVPQWGPLSVGPDAPVST